MLDIFTNLDPLKILGYGLSGFAFLLIIMIYFLLKSEQQRDNIRPAMIKAIFVFMGLNFLTIIIVGYISFSTMHENNILAEKNISLEVKKTAFEKSDEVSSGLADVEHELSKKDTGDMKPHRKRKLLQDFSLKSIKSLDSLSKAVKDNDPIISKTADSVKNEYAKVVQALSHAPENNLTDDSLKMYARKLATINKKFNSELLKK